MPDQPMKVKIIGVPLDLGSHPLGVEMGPAAIRYAGLIEALDHNAIPYVDLGDLPVHHRRDQPALAEIARVAEELAGLVSTAVAEGYVPIILGGDHSVAIGSIAGVAKQATRLGLLWIDCHPDANTPETSPSGNIHGMSIAIALGCGEPRLTNCFGFQPKVKPENVCIIGAKDIDKGEAEFLRCQGIQMFTLYDIQKYGIVHVIDEAYRIVSDGTDRIHVSFDIDSLDPVIAPGTGIISRGGLTYREISYTMRTFGERHAVSAIDVIEINPLLDVKNQTAELAVELLLLALGGSFGDYERHYLSRTTKLM